MGGVNALLKNPRSWKRFNGEERHDSNISCLKEYEKEVDHEDELSESLERPPQVGGGYDGSHGLYAGDCAGGGCDERVFRRHQW